MIAITQLTPSDVGRWVTYSVTRGHHERGRLKGWNKQFVFVVYRCGNRWEDFADYTAAPTSPQYLTWCDITWQPE
jgi:hypothetical protein